MRNLTLLTDLYQLTMMNGYYKQANKDEIAVFDCVDETACATVFEAVNERIEYLREGYSGYGPEEVPKIDSAALITLGNTVILCICENPEKAESIAVSAAK